LVPFCSYSFPVSSLFTFYIYSFMNCCHCFFSILP
jgi:hypothetical protein